MSGVIASKLTMKGSPAIDTVAHEAVYQLKTKYTVMEIKWTFYVSRQRYDHSSHWTLFIHSGARPLSFVLIWSRLEQPNITLTNLEQIMISSTCQLADRIHFHGANNTNMHRRSYSAAKQSIVYISRDIQTYTTHPQQWISYVIRMLHKWHHSEIDFRYKSISSGLRGVSEIRSNHWKCIDIYIYIYIYMPNDKTRSLWWCICFVNFDHVLCICQLTTVTSDTLPVI